VITGETTSEKSIKMAKNVKSTKKKRDNGGLRNSARQRNELERLENNELRWTKTTSAFLHLFAAPPKPNHSNNKIPTATQNFCSCFLEFNHTLK
jgi:hypothetical protein